MKVRKPRRECLQAFHLGPCLLGGGAAELSLHLVRPLTQKERKKFKRVGVVVEVKGIW